MGTGETYGIVAILQSNLYNLTLGIAALQIVFRHPQEQQQIRRQRYDHYADREQASYGLD